MKISKSKNSSECRLEDSLEKGSIEEFKRSLEFDKANFNSKHSSKDDSIFEVILQDKSDKSEYIKACIEFGAELYKENADRCYPIHLVANANNPKNFRTFLLQYKYSKMYLENNNGNTCLDILKANLLDFTKAEESEDLKNIIECIEIVVENTCSTDINKLKELWNDLQNNETNKSNLRKLEDKLSNALEQLEKPVINEDLSKLEINDFRTTLMKKKYNLKKNEIFTIFESFLEKPNSKEFIIECIKYGFDMYEESSQRSYLLHRIVERCHENLETFLTVKCEHPYSKINLACNGRNSLHILIEKLRIEYEHNENFERITESIKLLLLKGCDPLMPNEQRKTPFYCLLEIQETMQNVNHHNSKNVENLIEYFKNWAQIDTLQGTFAIYIDLKMEIDIHYLLYKSRFENVNGPKKLYNELINDSIEAFLKNPRVIYEAVNSNDLALLKFLLATDADVNKTFETKLPPVFLAAMKGYHKILAVLLEKEVITLFNERTLLHEICDTYFNFTTEEIDHHKCFHMILQKCSIDVNQQDDKKYTALHYAVQYKNEKAQKTLLKNGSTLASINDSNKTPLEEMRREVLEHYLDDCVSSKKFHSDEEVTEAQIFYPFLQDPKKINSRDQRKVPIESVRAISQNLKMRSLIRHPVVRCFVSCEWNNYQTFFKYGLFISILSLLLLLLLVAFRDHQLRNDNMDIVKEYQDVLKAIGLVLLIPMTLQQLLFYISSRSTTSGFFLILLLLYIVAYVSFYVFDFNYFSPLLDVSAVILVSCESFLLLSAVEKFDFAKYIAILRKVTVTFIETFISFVIPFVMFVLCFDILSVNVINSGSVNLCKHDAALNDTKYLNLYCNTGIAAVRLFISLTGEFDAADLNLEENEFILVLFVLFVFVGCMVMYNLMNALAIGNTEEILSESQLIVIDQKINFLCIINCFMLWVDYCKNKLMGSKENNQSENLRLNIKMNDFQSSGQSENHHSESPKVIINMHNVQSLSQNESNQSEFSISEMNSQFLIPMFSIRLNKNIFDTKSSVDHEFISDMRTFLRQKRDENGRDETLGKARVEEKIDKVLELLQLNRRNNSSSTSEQLYSIRLHV